MEIEKKMCQLACKSIFMTNINTGNEKAINTDKCVLNFSTKQTKKNVAHVITGRPWETIEPDMFTFNDTNCVWVVDYHSMFPIVKITEDLSAENLSRSCQIVFVEYRLLKTFDYGTDFI